MDLNAVKMFVRIAEMKSFTSAAAALRMTQSGLSRAVGRLEEGLGVKLLHRSTRSVSLTHEGEQFYAGCAGLIAEFDEAEARIQDDKRKPSGVLKVSAPLAFGRLVLRPALSAMCLVYPGLAIELHTTDRMVDLVDEGFDAAVRIGRIDDPSLVVRRLGVIRYTTVAAPAYLARHGTPQTPQDLLDHNCLNIRFPRTGKLKEWEFAEHGAVTRMQPGGNLVCDTGETLVDAAIDGQGVFQAQDFMCRRALADGTLVALLDDYVTERGPVSLAYRKSRQQSPKTAALIAALDHMVF